MMKILLFGGTTEGRLLAERLVGMGHQVTVSVATELGAEILQGQFCGSQRNYMLFHQNVIRFPESSWISYVLSCIKRTGERSILF